MYSRLDTGSASTPRRPRSLAAVVPTRSRKRSPSATTSAGGAANDDSTDTGSPASLPGV